MASAENIDAKKLPSSLSSPSSTENGESSGRQRIFFPNLDGLRFLAFLAVYLQHGLGDALGSSAGRSALLTTLYTGIFSSGWAGVSFFFVLSGFLITYLILAEVEWSGKLNVPAFYMRRVLRIWPLYYAVLLFGFWLYPTLKSAIGMSSYIETGNPLNYLLFLSNFDVLSLGKGQGAMSINITWSVAIKEQFYIVWPLLFSSCPRAATSSFSLRLFSLHVGFAGATSSSPPCCIFIR